MKIQSEIETWASILNESEKDPIQREISEDIETAAKICAEEDDPVQEDDTEIAEGFTDVRLPHDRVKHHDTGLEVKYWVAVDEHSELLTNYGWFVDQNLNKIPVANNTTPSVTNDLTKAIALAKRASAKWPDCYVMIGKDDHSRGAMTQKNHLRSGAIVDCWIPEMKFWRDGVVESCNEAGVDVMDNWRKMQAEKVAQQDGQSELPSIREITITGAQIQDSRALVQYDIKWSDGKEEKDNLFNTDTLDDEFIKAGKQMRSKSDVDTAIALLQSSYDGSSKSPIAWMYYNPKTGVRASENQFSDIKSGKARLRGVKTAIDPAKEKAAELAYKMNQQFGNSRLHYKVEAESQIAESSKSGQPYMHDAETDGPIVTVRDLKEILKNFDDNDVINVCDTEGVPDHKFVSMWNAEYENSTVGLDADQEEHVCYFRIGV